MRHPPVRQSVVSVSYHACFTVFFSIQTEMFAYNVLIYCCRVSAVQWVSRLLFAMEYTNIIKTALVQSMNLSVMKTDHVNTHTDPIFLFVVVHIVSMQLSILP